ncbi:MAG: hypothetical protein Q9222_005190 [Ikaeria aurantiellina]
MEMSTAQQKPTRHLTAAQKSEPASASGGLRSRISSLFAIQSEKRPPATPNSNPSDTPTAANSDVEAITGSSSRGPNFDTALTKTSSSSAIRLQTPIHNYDGSSNQTSDPNTGTRRRRSTQHGVAPNLSSESDGQSISTRQRETTENALGRNRGSLRQSGVKAGDESLHRTRSTLPKQPTFPRKSLYNMRAESTIDSNPIGKSSKRSLEEPQLRINHVPGSFRSDFEASLPTSRSASPVSGQKTPPVIIEPLPDRSFEAASSWEPNKIPSSPPDRAVNTTHGVEEEGDQNGTSTRVPLLRPMISSYTIRETPSIAAFRANPTQGPLTLHNIIANSEDQILDRELGEAMEASSSQALSPDLRSENAVAVIDLQLPKKPPTLPISSNVEGPMGDVSTLPRSKTIKALSSINLRSSQETLRTRETSNEDLGIKDSSSRQKLRGPPSLSKQDNEQDPQDPIQVPRVKRQPTVNPYQPVLAQPNSSLQVPESDSKQHWMRQLLGQKSAPVMGQAPPNLTTRPHHRSRKITDDVPPQRSNTLPAQAPKAEDDIELRSPEGFARAITDLEGLLQQALQIAGKAGDGATNRDVSAMNPSGRTQTGSEQKGALNPDTRYESYTSSDDDTSSDSTGLDEEQHRTTMPRQEPDRHVNHITVVEPDDTDRYHGYFKRHRKVTPYPHTLRVPTEDFSKEMEMDDEDPDPSGVGKPNRDLTVSGQQQTASQPVPRQIKGYPADVQNVLLHPMGATSSSVDTADWALKRQPTSAPRQPSIIPGSAEPLQQLPLMQAPVNEVQSSSLRERRPSKTPTSPEPTNLTVYSEPKSYSSGDDKDPIAYFSDRPPSELQNRGVPHRRRAAEKPPLGPGPMPREDVLTPLPSDVGGHGPGSDPKSLDLKHRHHFSIREPKMFSLSHSHRRSPIARDWSTPKKRWVALVACINTALIGLIVGIYAGEVPAIQYNIVDEHHYTILGNVVLFIGLAITTAIFWPLPLLYGRKPFTLAALAILMPLQFPQAVAVNGFRTPYTPTYRVSLLLSRAIAGLVMGFANINFIATLLDLFGASLQSVNPHQEVVNVNDVRRHGGGMGIWLGIWTWCFIGSIGFGFFIGAVIISRLEVDWGFWITIILTAFVLVLNVLIPEVRRSPYRRSVAEVRTPTELSRRVARGEVKMHLYSTGPKWWIEEVMAGSVLCVRMLQQPGFLVLSTYIGWIYGQIVMIILLLGALTSRYYRYRPQYVGLCVLAIPIGALLAVPFQRASVLSRSRQKPPRTDSMTVNKRLTWTSHFVRRAVFMVSLPLAGLAYTLASVGTQVSVAAPTVFAGLIGFLSNLAIAECNGIIMETYDTSDLQPGMTGRPRRDLPEEIRKKRTNFSSFPRVTAAFAISQTFAFLIAAAATGTGGAIERRLGAQAATAVVAGILLILTLLLIAVVTRFKEIQIIPTQRYGTNVLSGPEDEWKPVIIGNPSGTTRRMSILEMGNMTRWKEIRRRNRLTGFDGY